MPERRHRWDAVGSPRNGKAWSHARGLRAVFGLLLAGLVGCGAKTGLLAPCVLPVERVTPRVVLVLDHSASTSMQFGGTQTVWDTLTAGLLETLPHTASYLEVGALVFPAPLDWTVGVTCDIATQLQVLPSAHGTQQVIELLRTYPVPDYGLTPTFDALRVAAAEARRDLPAGRPIVLLLATDGGPNCNGDLTPAECVCSVLPVERCFQPSGRSYSCSDSLRSIGGIAQLAREGISTIVLGIEAPTLPEPERQTLEAMARAGGHPADGARAYYSASNPAELETGLLELLLAQSFCHLHSAAAAGRAPDSMALALRTTATDAGAVLPHDPARHDGWDWTDRARGQLELFGPACARVAHAREVPAFLTREARCDVP